MPVLQMCTILRKADNLLFNFFNRITKENANLLAQLDSLFLCVSVFSSVRAPIHFDANALKRPTRNRRTLN